jgi:hypothetical protein
MTLCGCSVTTTLAGGYSHELLASDHGAFAHLAGAFIDSAGAVGVETLLHVTGGEGGFKVAPYLGIRAGEPTAGWSGGFRVGVTPLAAGYDRAAEVGTLGASALAEVFVGANLSSQDWVIGESSESLEFIFGLTADVGYGEGGDGVTLLFGLAYTMADSL